MESRFVALPRRSAGFTLVELLIVVVIIGILASIAIPKFNSTRERSYKAAMVSDLKNLALVQEAYFNEHHTFGDLGDLEVSFIKTEGVNIQCKRSETGLGWWATATHKGIPDEDKKCWIFHGDAESPDPAAKVPSRVECSF